MPRKRKPARIYYRKPRPGKDRGGWVILDGGREHRTTASSEREAEAALGQYLIEKTALPDSPREREAITIGDVLTIYLEQHGPHVADPARLDYAIAALMPFWAEQKVSAVKGETCRRYVSVRGVGHGTIRRELTVLRAALNHCEREGYLLTAPTVTLPSRPPSRDRWLTRNEVAALIRATRRGAKTRHLARLILIAVYTGTRSGAILKLQWEPNTLGGHVDLERGVLYRAPAATSQTKKRQTPARLPGRLLAHLQRWRGRGPVISYQGGPIDKVKSRTWKALCDRAGIEPCTVHDLRHTAACWLMQNGADQWDAAGYLGMTMATLEQVYAHHHPDHQRSAVEAIGRKS